MACDAVVALVQFLEDIDRSPSRKNAIPDYKEQEIESLLESLNTLHNFLEDPAKNRFQDAQHLETKIRDASCKAQNLIESQILSYATGEKWLLWHFPRRNRFCANFKAVTSEIDSIKKEVIGLPDPWNANDRHASGSMVGHHTDFEKIKEQLFTQSARLQVIPIIGMGGIGKTTLAERLFQDPCVVEYFPVRVWVTVSQNYREKYILLSLVRFMTEHSHENSQDSNDVLRDRIHKFLRTHIYLIVMDDVWNTEVWDLVRSIFPDDSNGSRILLTTRLDSVALYVNPNPYHHHKMHLLNSAESWNLLRLKVFRGKYCPSALEVVGKRIARDCEGLPFTIVHIGGLLSRLRLPLEISAWESVARDVNAHIISNDEQWQVMLSLSYDYLPPCLKEVFLYMGVFREDFQVPVSKLVKLWIAEEFLKPIESKSLEEIAEEYLTELISRNLVLIGDKRPGGSIKTCKLHDLTRKFCLIKAQEENFFHSIDTNSRSFPQGFERSPRLSCRGDLVEKIFHKAPQVRSLLSQEFDIYDGSGNGSLQVCKLLRVLDFARVHMESFPYDILNLVHLRYVSLHCEQEVIRIPQELPDSLKNLQTLIIYKFSYIIMLCDVCLKVYLPEGIWRMSQLRHLHFRKCYLPCPPRSLHLTNLVTLSKLSSCSYTKDLCKRTPSLRKLGITVEESGGDAPFSLGNVSNLPQLEMLKIIVEPGSKVYIPINYTLPPKLKKLTLTGTNLQWTDMSIVFSLHNLEELELINNAFIGLKWKPRDGDRNREPDQFRKLKSLLIRGMNLQSLKANGNHFPQLQRLSLWECDKLKKFPARDDIQTLEMIELDDASPYAVSKAREMQQNYLENYEDEGFIVRVHFIWNKDYQKRKEAREARRRKEAEEEERKRRERPRYSGVHPGSSSRSRHDFSTPTWERMHESRNSGFHGGLGGGFGPHGFGSGSSAGFGPPPAGGFNAAFDRGGFRR